MKKTVTIFLGLMLMFIMTACGASDSENKENNNVSKQTFQNEQGQQEDLGKTLVVYFSMPETTDPKNMTEEEANSIVVIDGEVIGNTQYVANVIQESTEADIFRIEPKTQYPTEHDVLVEVAKKEQSDNIRPELKNHIDDISQYNTIFIGYPTWWSDIPMILYSFLDEYDFSGKTIIPFNTHGGSGFADTINTISELEPKATVLKDGFTVSRNDVEEAKNDIVSWLNGLKLE
ncbi:flavodoxin [Clostridioides sp. ZZV15-6597]|uniref:flavodoxin n=1 Tax=Clostridioides sp. ZZV15-6597 TaxID=2811500 RepID=UPI001D118AE0|nr:flavodoxin [Clostridioides sp. ZZV15-6597]